MALSNNIIKNEFIFNIESKVEEIKTNKKFTIIGRAQYFNIVENQYLCQKINKKDNFSLDYTNGTWINENKLKLDE